MRNDYYATVQGFLLIAAMWIGLALLLDIAP